MNIFQKIKKIKEASKTFEKDYESFVNLLVDKLNENELEFIKNKGVNYVSELFNLFMENNKNYSYIINHIQLDLLKESEV